MRHQCIKHLGADKKANENSKPKGKQNPKVCPGRGEIQYSQISEEIIDQGEERLIVSHHHKNHGTADTRDNHGGSPQDP